VDEMIAKYGRPKVSQIVSHFYSRVLHSPELAHYFEDVHIRTLVDHQAAFMEAVMGGPQSHTSQELQIIHSNLSIDESDFDEMLRILGETMRSFYIDDHDVDHVVGRYEQLRPMIVTAGR
jgi:hemoglobin